MPSKLKAGSRRASTPATLSEVHQLALLLEAQRRANEAVLDYLLNKLAENADQHGQRGRR